MYVCPETALELESDPFAGDVWRCVATGAGRHTHADAFFWGGDGLPDAPTSTLNTKTNPNPPKLIAN